METAKNSKQQTALFFRSERLENSEKNSKQQTAIFFDQEGWKTAKNQQTANIRFFTIRQMSAVLGSLETPRSIPNIGRHNAQTDVNCSKKHILFLYISGMRSMCSHAFSGLFIFWDFICLKSLYFPGAFFLRAL